MAFTWFDCQFYRGSGARGDTSSFSAFCPVNEAGTLIFAGSLASKDSIGSQVACKLALEHFLSGAATSLAKKASSPGIGSETQNGELKREPGNGSVDRAARALEDAFKNANNSVYQFGHKLSAGGRLSTSLMGLIVSEGQVAVGRVGIGSTYLCRGSHIYPFFEAGTSGVGDDSAGKQGSSVGSNSLVSVELASVTLEEYDKLLILPREIDPAKQAKLSKMLDKDVSCISVCKEFFSENHAIPFAFLLSCGPVTTYLSRSLKIAPAFADSQ